MKKLEAHPLAERLPIMSDQEFEALKASLKGGQIDPIITLDGKILDGRHRQKALAELGIEPRYVEFKSSWGSPVEYVIAKSLHRNMTDGQRVCAAELFMDDLVASGKFTAREGKSSEYAALRFGVSQKYVEQVRQIRKQAPAIYKEIFTGGLNVNQAINRARHRTRKAAVNKLRRANNVTMDDCRLLLGDNIDRLGEMKSKSVRCVFADPPYNNGWKYDADPRGDKRPDFIQWCEGWIEECARVLTDDGSLFVLIDDENSDAMGMALRKSGLHRHTTIVWWESFGAYTETKLTAAARFIHYYTKQPAAFFNTVELRDQSDRQKIKDKRANPAGQVPDNVWQISRKQGTASDRVPFKDAPPQLPVEIPERCILLATEPGDTVLDPFNGNGTSGIASLRNGRKYIGIDRSQKYIEQSRKWIAHQLQQGAANA